MAAPDIVWKGGRFGRTSRRDPWWLSPSAVLLGLSAFLVYSTWAAWQGNTRPEGVTMTIDCPQPPMQAFGSVA